MQKRELNPTTWLVDAFNVNQGVEVTQGQRTLYVAGQTSNDAQGNPVYPHDLVAQFRKAFENIVEVLVAADMGAENIVRLNFYTTDVELFMSKAEELVPIWAQAGCKPVATLLGVERLFQPGLLIELEATAVA